MVPWQMISVVAELAGWLMTRGGHLTPSRLMSGGRSIAACSAVMQIWLVIGWPGCGILMPRFFIISITSGVILGMAAICMVVVTFHRPGLPWGMPRAAAGIRIAAVRRVEANLRVMGFP